MTQFKELTVLSFYKLNGPQFNRSTKNLRSNQPKDEYSLLQKRQRKDDVVDAYQIQDNDSVVPGQPNDYDQNVVPKPRSDDSVDAIQFKDDDSLVPVQPNEYDHQTKNVSEEMNVDPKPRSGDSVDAYQLQNDDSVVPDQTKEYDQVVEFDIYQIVPDVFTFLNHEFSQELVYSDCQSNEDDLGLPPLLIWMNQGYGYLNQDDDEQPKVPFRRFTSEYCYCRHDLGEELELHMIGCENMHCELKWFHLDCAGLEKMPHRNKKWLCDYCTE
jgi:hypothetical protein